MTSFTVQVAYSQLAVFNGKMDKPLNKWTHHHVRQGFSWRKGSVSFKTLEEDCELSIQLNLVDKFPPINQKSAQVIEVPFAVGTYGIEIGSVTASEAVSIPEGNYELRIELLDGSRFALLWFSSKEEMKFNVVKLHQSSELPTDLILTAEPA